MKRRKYIDTRPDWRDPNMPVLLLAQPVGSTDNKYTLCEFPSEDITNYFKAKMNSAQNAMHPDWRHDPTYNMKRKKNV